MSRYKLGGFTGAVLAAFLAIGCSQSDPGITTAVKGKLAADDVVKSYRIDVDTKDKVVTLNGSVDTAAARERAVRIARDTEGVRDVVDRLTVSPGATPTTGIDDKVAAESKEAARDADRKTDEAQKKGDDALDKAGNAVTDAALTSAVKTKFLADDQIAGLKIDVDTNKGIVTLSGPVRSAAEKQRAVKIARETDGVKSVVDKLKVVK
jgi:hyperosmotically inducible periplasmic protein